MVNESKHPCDLKDLFFNGEGRLGRQTFNLIAGAAFLFLTFSAFILPFPGQAIVFLVILAVTISPTVKRLHDREYSGIWYAYFVLVIILAMILIAAPIAMIVEYAKVALYANTVDPSHSSVAVWNPAHALAFLIMLGTLTYLAMIGWFLAELCFFRGTEGPNEYGSDPIDCTSFSCGSSV